MSRTLSRDRFEAARAFVEEQGRPLDAALLRQSLGEGSGDEVLEALAPFQNPDGGFGHGLEPDIRSPASSAIATSLGLRFLARAGPQVRPAARARMIEPVVGWLEVTFDRDRGVWPIVGADVDLAPHAPWWAWSPESPASWNGCRFNPTAEILAWLYDHRDVTPPQLILAADLAFRRALAQTGLIEGAYDLKCAARVASSTGAPPELADTVAERVSQSLAAHDPADEHLSPLEICPAPGCRFAGALGPWISAALDRLIETQQPDGGWSPFWDWSGVDADAWAGAQADWRGWLTREALEQLLAWGRVEAA